jgi:DNA-binding Lrp family transcriptional regulator
MERIAMSQEERDWLDWLKRARDGHVTQRKAAEQMGISDRWVRALLAEMKKKGDAVVVHGLRGHPSNRRVDEKIRGRAMEIVKSADWHDFKPTFAAEQLAKRHQIRVSKETVRQWMIAEGIWQSQGRKVKEVHPWRPRRSHYGELVQWDTSDHDWLEGRGEPVPHLVRMIDDATSRSWGRFVARDSTRENMGVLWEYVERFGRAVDYYTDRDSMFTVAPRPGESKEQQRAADRPDADRPGAAGVGDRLDCRLFAASQRARGAELSDRPGPADQGAAPGEGEDHRRAAACLLLNRDGTGDLGTPNTS